MSTASLSTSTAGAHVGPAFLRRTLVPLTLLTTCPPFVLVLWYTHTQLGGSLAELWAMMQAHGIFATIWEIWRPHLFGSGPAWAILGIFAAIQLVFLRVLPGRTVYGPVTPAGNVPEYRDNGLLAFTLTQGGFLALSYGAGLFDASILYTHLGDILGALNVFSLVFCLGLYLKGRFAPSTADHGLSGNPIFDYYWGTELYPRVLGWDVKQFTNCRFGMMIWPTLLLSYAAAQAERHGLSTSMMVAVGVQLFYIAKFFWWESGYLRSLDIMHDRAGFYICWGCLVWVPSVYTQSTLYLVDHPWDMGVWAPIVAVAGVVAVSINYLADAQRQRVRATDGKTTVWGKPPVLIPARYTTEKGEAKTNLLLASGWWGVARHFHYVPEILGAALWTVPVGFTHALPWFYVVFLTILLTDRAFRDDARCAAKYGADWKVYCEKVRWRIVPGLL